MPLTKEQLLIPRYMCTGTPGKPLWEGSPFFHGAVFHGEIYRLMNIEVSGHTDYNFSNMPHLFRPMPWWEGRKPEEMPEWVKFSENYMNFKAGSVYETECWSDKHYDCIQFRSEEGLCGVPFGKWVEPATEQEYLDYQKQKEAL